MNEVYRQGDVLIQRVAALPKGESKPVHAEAGRLILAYGEVTGHSHAVLASAGEAELVELIETVERYLTVHRATTVVHEEHGEIALEPGVYRVWTQREYSPQEIRRVID